MLGTDDRAATDPHSVGRPQDYHSYLFLKGGDKNEKQTDRLDEVEPSGRLPPSPPIQLLASTTELDEGAENGETGD
jgi:hypothetical protein